MSAEPASAGAVEPAPARRRVILAGIGLALFLTLAVVAALGVGPGEISFAEILTAFAAKLSGRPLAFRTEAILWELRLPRVLLALLVGAGLGSAGALTQGLFRNPLASPGVLGISTGSAAAVMLGFVLGLDERALWATPALAGIGAVVMLALLFALTARRRDLAQLLLTGVALNALAGALGTLLLALFLDRPTLAQKAMAWTLGSFDGRGFPHLRAAVLPLSVGMLGAWTLHRPLDAMALGEETAASLGVDPGRLRVGAALLVGLLVGTSTAAVGVIGFVGLIVPHLARSLPWVGSADHGRLLPASMLTGAALMLGVDTLSRASTPTFLPPGALTSLLGGLFFLWLLRRQTPEQGI
ncbi:iron ABC transporter permease [Pseudenhygromyxa sp. WMMC2535]|uniref:FecCD family ABC transporter permease n=1 Tax=Pseudenhygromyxa sp. WMMC2535 TaxID=2712867 RepID=UPI00155280AC|nr:iron ABC transporter permease [Pseudenhygromyxa sp. WMMC2535]NVB38553.1 iron ABC transporter permease [Pseudenhygromyxa sp. WMMC2535]